MQDNWVSGNAVRLRDRLLDLSLTSTKKCKMLWLLPNYLWIFSQSSITEGHAQPVKKQMRKC